MTQVISFSSGKGGVGKTSIVANLGYLYARQGKKVLLVDGDWALGKLSITLGVYPKWTIQQVLTGEIALQEAVCEVLPNLHLLASPSGVVGFEELSIESRNQLYFELEELGEIFDIILFDHSSGVHWGVLQFAAAAHQNIIVTTTEPTSYTDAYAIMKILSKRFSIRSFALLVTMSASRAETQKVFSKFGDLARQQLQIRLELLDILAWEPKLAESIRRQKLFVSSYPQAELTKQLCQLGRVLEKRARHYNHGLNFFCGKQIEQAPLTEK